MEAFINYIISTDLPLLIILLIAFATTFMENVFPPAPGDTIVIVLGALIGLGKADFLSVVTVATIGSTVGFIVMFLIGRFLGQRIIDSNRFKYINEKNLEKPRNWFRKYGYTIIIINRFLTGTRAVISFIAGISKMNFGITIILSAVSSLVWNGLLIYFGMLAGENWREIDNYITLYGYILLPIFVIIAAIFIYKWYKNKKKEATEEK